MLVIHCWICKTIFVLSHNFSPGRLLLLCQYLELPTYRELPSVLFKELITTKERTEILQVVIFYHFICLKNYLLWKTVKSLWQKPQMQQLWTLQTAVRPFAIIQYVFWKQLKCISLVLTSCVICHSKKKKKKGAGISIENFFSHLLLLMFMERVHIFWVKVDFRILIVLELQQRMKQN